MSLSAIQINLKHPSFRFPLILGCVILIFVFLRWPLIHVPMERDEGEYATMGLGILHGTPPYLESYTMKFPGTAFLYAVVFSLLGPSVRSIHVALLLANTAAILLVAILGRRLIGASAGLFAAAAYGTLAIGTGVFGLWLSAEHFAVIFLLAGALTMPFSLEGRWVARWMVGSFLLGIAILVKQHAVFPAAGWLIATGWILFGKSRSISLTKRMVLVMGMILAFTAPLMLTGAVMVMCGVFDAFRFWTFQYAFRYASAVPFTLGWEYFKMGVGQVFQDAPLLWMLSLAGTWILLWKSSYNPDLDHGWWREKMGETRRLLLSATLGAMIAVSAGLMFRGQYFILLAPFAALLSGLTWEFFRQRIRMVKWSKNVVGTAVLITSFAVLLEPLYLGWWRKPDEVCRWVYGMNPFPEYQAVADYLRRHMRPDEKVAVIGSEPGIYFLADRRPAMPYLYVYEMMKPHASARLMQQEAIHCIEASRPRCMVMVNVPTSWGRTSRSDLTFLEWFQRYAREHYMLDGVVDLISETETAFRWGNEARSYRPQSRYTLMIFVRKD